MLSNEVNFHPVVESVEFKQTLREKIQNEIEQFKNAGGIITEMKVGDTFAKETTTPFNRSTPRTTEQKRAVGSSSKGKVAISPHKPLNAKPRAPKKPIDLEAEKRRAIRKRVNELKVSAINSKSKEFIGPCAVHVEARYTIRTNGAARCVECSDSHKKHKLDAETRTANKARKKINQDKMQEALALNKEEFIGSCMNCIESLFRIRMVRNKKDHGPLITYNYACIECFKKSVRLSENKRRDKKKNLN